jgi:hypothetical protein
MGIIKKMFWNIRNDLNIDIEIKKLSPRPTINFVKSQFKDKKLTGIEIGTYRGVHARNILKFLNIERLYLIDPYEIYDEESIVTKTLVPAEKSAHKILKKYSDRIIWIRKPSDKAVNDIKEEVDFVYIDGNHSYEYAKKDIELYYLKLKLGGIMGGHDFNNSFNPSLDGVVKAVLEFVNKNNLKLYVDYRDWYFVKDSEINVKKTK